MPESAAIVTGAFRFLPVDGVLFGPGQVTALPGELERLQRRRAFIITGRSLATKTDLVRRVERLLGERHVGTFAETRQHVPSQGVIAAALQARSAGADVLVSVGGSSPVDCAKLVALALAEEWTDADQLNARADRISRVPPARPPIPQVAITTTLSAGEFTMSAGVTNEKTGRPLRRSPRRHILHHDAPRHWLLRPPVAFDAGRSR